MRIRGPGIGILVALLMPVESSLAVNQTVTATSQDVFTPAAVTVSQGESVTWTTPADSTTSGSTTTPSRSRPRPIAPPWTVSRTFSTVGTSRYYCEAHGGPGGLGMSGTVTVQAAGATPGPPGPGPGGPGPPAPVSADKVKPALKLGGQTTQKVLRKRAVVVAVEVNEASTVVAAGTVAVPGASKVIRLKKASKQLAAGAQAKLKLKLPKQAPRAFRRAFDRGRRLTAKVTVTAKDAAGNTRSAKRKIALKT